MKFYFDISLEYSNLLVFGNYYFKMLWTVSSKSIIIFDIYHFFKIQNKRHQYLVERTKFPL